MHRLILAALLVLALLCTDSFSATASEPCPGSLSKAEIRAVNCAFRSEVKRQQIVGAAVAVIRNGQIVHRCCYGFEDREACIPVNSKTLFRWASISKTLTAVAAMQLVEQGKLDLDADVRSYVNEFPDKGVRITPRQLLCHQGGIIHYRNGEVIKTRRNYKKPHPFENVIVALDRFKESPLIAAPGEKYSYSTHGFMLLSAVVERAGQEIFADQIRRRIVEPLGMKTLQPDYQWKTIPHRTIGYRKKKGKIVRSIDDDVSWKLGGGGFLSNIDDLARWAVGLIHGRLIDKSTETSMWTVQKTSDGRPTPVGLGFFIKSRQGVLEVSHGGAQHKTRTRLVIWPREGRGIVVMCNSEYADTRKLISAVNKTLANNAD